MILDYSYLIPDFPEENNNSNKMKVILFIRRIRIRLSTVKGKIALWNSCSLQSEYFKMKIRFYVVNVDNIYVNSRCNKKVNE